MNSSNTSNNRFKFKQFEMCNSLSGLKIGTDGVLLGAWCDVSSKKIVWDVGSGTGLIALMIAQRCDAKIYAIEIDDVSAGECEVNISNSAWSDRLSVVKDDVFSVSSQLPRPDLIVCNPPFFGVNSSLEARNESRDCARRSVSLSVEKLIALASEVLSPGGALCFIVPFDKNSDIEYAASINKMNVRATVDVITREGKLPVRRLWRLEREAGPLMHSDLMIRTADGNYSEEYMMLTKDYYLKF